MSFNNGDIVRIGKGKVEYTISDFNADGTVNLAGAKSNRKNVDTDTLTLVHTDWISDADVSVPVMTDSDVTTVAQDIAVKASTGLVLIVDGHAKLTGKSFDTLAFELSRLAGAYQVAAIARNGRAVVERKAA